MIGQKFQPGESVHVDADTLDWGRVASAAIVVQDYPNQYVQVEASSIRAVVTVHRRGVVRRSP